MAVTLNERAYDHARSLVEQRRVVLDDRGEWSEHGPAADDENRYLDEHGRCRFPYGDFAGVHRCGVLSAESRAAQQRCLDIERACAHLDGMLDALMSTDS
jgi:hypothetical protein